MPNLRSRIRAFLVPGLVGGVVALGACGDSATDLAACEALVDLFPVPVNEDTSPFSEIDDDYLEVNFASGFQFSFFGAQYSSVFLNTNGGMTFGSGTNEWDPAAAEVLSPTIAVFWGDLDADGSAASRDRPNQMSYQACGDRFVVVYSGLQDHSEDNWVNSATATLEADGRIMIAYGAVLSETVLAGVFDGTHTDDQYVTLQNDYSGYSTNGTGTILFDYEGLGPPHAGELSNRTITYTP